MPEEISDTRIRKTLDGLLQGFQIIGFDWTYLYVNPVVAGQGRSTPAQLLGRKMWDAYPGIEQTPLFDHLRRCMTDRKPVSLENLFVFPNGDRRWFELRVEPVPEGICIHSVDIHSRKEAQAALEQLNSELEARVVARTRELETVNAELEAFSHSVSHDLRAPLRHVNSFATVLSEDAKERLTNEDRESLDRIMRATQRMTTMIDALLEFARLGRRPLQMEAVELSELVRAAQSDVSPDADGREVVWSIPPLPRVNADGTLLRMAIVNLFSNALKYTRGRTPARIVVDAKQDDRAGELVLCVSDNGVGFDMRHADKLFGVFQRLHTEKEFDGTGIGLANVRRIVARHGGRTWAEGAVGTGATFYLSLPAQPAASL